MRLVTKPQLSNEVISCTLNRYRSYVGAWLEERTAEYSYAHTYTGSLQKVVKDLIVKGGPTV